MPMSAGAKAYYDAHAQALREHGAMNARRLWPRQALLYTTVNGAQLQPFPCRMPARSVAPAVRSALKKHLVHEYEVAARDGSLLRIVYIRHAHPAVTSAARRKATDLFGSNVSRSSWVSGQLPSTSPSRITRKLGCSSRFSPAFAPSATRTS
ncbi:hypothetical protein [Streptomyces sp. NPDC023588]|uniref:hypothetical protein n=1 Tax=Streptomyces sp. NPDC023588 TaxID=3154907 RepID=UPI0033E95BC4